MENIKKKICNLYNIPSHYRKRIYQMMDEEFDCTFVFGDEDLKIKKMRLTDLKNAKETHVGRIKSAAFQWGIIPYAFKRYDAYIMTGATNNITQWLMLILLKLMPHKKAYIWTHGLYGYENTRQMFIRRLFYSLFDGFFLYGEFSRDNMIKANICCPKKLHIIHNSLDYDEQLAIRNEIKSSSIYQDYFGNNYPVLVFIGRLTKVKKLDMILDAINTLRSKGKEFNMVFIGDGTERSNLELKTIKLGLYRHIWFYGECYDEKENANLIYNADLCVSPGNVGLTALHSMMFGTPVITHNNFSRQMPEFQTIKEWKTGAYFKENEILSLADSIENWFNIHSQNRNNVRNNCYRVIDEEWNPYYQINVFKKVLCP